MLLKETVTTSRSRHGSPKTQGFFSPPSSNYREPTLTFAEFKKGERCLYRITGDMGKVHHVPKVIHDCTCHQII